MVASTTSLKSIRLLLMTGACLGVWVLSPPVIVQAADPEMKIEVTITDKGYDVKGHTNPG